MSSSNNDTNMSDTHPAPDLQRSLVPSNGWWAHLANPSVAAASNDINHVKNLLAAGTADYKNLQRTYYEQQQTINEMTARADKYQRMYEEATRANGDAPPHANIAKPQTARIQ